MRGEYENGGDYNEEGEELPPRARRILGDPAMTTFGRGTTSACAENTGRPEEWATHLGNYLRVRGEYAFTQSGLCRSPELPPRARRIVLTVHAEIILAGTTSACAENTLFRVVEVFTEWNYLRVRGEYIYLMMS